jgi:hypothetical protein
LAEVTHIKTSLKTNIYKSNAEWIDEWRHPGYSGLHTQPAHPTKSGRHKPSLTY